MSSVFRFNDAHDRESASDGVSRYGFYLRDRPDMFADWDDSGAVSTDPARFTRAAWEIANSPVMSPSYVVWDAERLQSVTCAGSELDGSLIVRVQLAVPRPVELRSVLGFGEWERGGSWGGPRGYFVPYDDSVARGPVMLTSTVLLFGVPTDQLYVPRDAPEKLSVDDAKASVKRLGALLDDRLSSVLKALG